MCISRVCTFVACAPAATLHLMLRHAFKPCMQAVAVQLSAACIHMCAVPYSRLSETKCKQLLGALLLTNTWVCCDQRFSSQVCGCTGAAAVHGATTTPEGPYDRNKRLAHAWSAAPAKVNDVIWRVCPVQFSGVCWGTSGCVSRVSVPPTQQWHCCRGWGLSGMQGLIVHALHRINMQGCILTVKIAAVREVAACCGQVSLCVGVCR